MRRWSHGSWELVLKLLGLHNARIGAGARVHRVALKTIENPHAKGYPARGSASGAAAFVGACLMDVAIGADQGGSIGVPAALCGIIGLKLTNGLVPYTGFGSNDVINGR